MSNHGDDTEDSDGIQAFRELSDAIRVANSRFELLNSSVSHSVVQQSEQNHQAAAIVSQAREAARMAVEANQAQVWGQLLPIALIALGVLAVASGGGFYAGYATAWAKGQAEGYASSRSEAAAASWANTPAGRRGYLLDQTGSLDMVTACSGRGWNIETQNGRRVCFPAKDSQGRMAGWFVP